MVALLAQKLLLSAVVVHCGLRSPPQTATPPSGDASRQEIQSHFERAQDALKSGKADVADREFRAVLALDPKNVDARANLGVSQLFQGDYTGAADQFREALKIQPSLWKAQALLGLCERRLGRIDDARRLLENSMPHLEDGTVRTQAGLELIEILYQAHELERAVGVVQLLERSQRPNVDALFTAYRIYTALANDARDALMAIAPDSGRMQQLIAQHLVNAGDLPGAIKHYREALEKSPWLRGIHYELGEAVLLDSSSSSALQEAEKEFRAALAENPGEPNAEYKLGKVFEKRLDFQAAMQHYSRALKLRPDHVDAQIGMGTALMKLDEPAKALDYLLPASRLDPTKVTLHYQLSQVYRKLGRDSDSQHELSVFREQSESKKRMEEIYLQLHEVVPRETDPVPAGTPQGN